MMAPPLRLSLDTVVHYFGSSCNSSRIGKYLVLWSLLLNVARPLGEAPDIDASTLAADVITLKVVYFLKTF